MPAPLFTNLICAIVLGLCARACPALDIDLREIGHIAPKGRVQDRQYNTSLPVVDQLIAAGPEALDFLVSKLDDNTQVPGPVMDYWPDVRVGDVAWIILGDFLTTADWKGSTIKPALDSLIEDRQPDRPYWQDLGTQIRKDGRDSIRWKVENLLKPYAGRFSWDSDCRCFAPIPKVQP